MPVQTSASDEAEQRLILLESCSNFRDVGGYLTEDGHMVRWGRLFRSDGLNRVTEADLATLSRFGSLTVLDLRTADELAERGRAPAAAVAAHHHLPMIDVLPTEDELALWLDAPSIASRYREMLDQGTDAVRGALGVLADPASYPAVIHCAAGKDRTGILVALIHNILGVPEDAIVADYALSGPAMQRKLAKLQQEYPDAREALDRYASAMLSAEPATMHLFLEGLCSDYGSVPGYIDHIGMGQAVEHIRSALLDRLTRRS